MFNILSRKLFGNNYKKLITSVVIAGAVYMGLSGLEYKIAIAHKILMLINIFFSSSIMFQFLGSKDNTAYLKGYFAMPFDKKNFTLSYALSMGIYVLFTKVLLLYTLLFAFGKGIDILEIILITAEYVFICPAVMLVFAFFSDKKALSLLIAAGSMAMCILLPKSYISLAVYAAVSIVFIISLIFTDPYRFMKSTSSGLHKVKGGNSKHFLIFKYITRYLMSNRSYLLNPVITLAFVSFLVKNMADMGFKEGILIGFAMLTINTPLAVIVSSNRGLHKKLDSMPSRIKNFFSHYACVLFVFYIICDALFIAILYILGVEIQCKAIIAAIFFSIQAAAATAFMEDKYHITKWSVEADLWHNPRKYIVPITLALEAGLLSLI